MSLEFIHKFEISANIKLHFMKLREFGKVLEFHMSLQKLPKSHDINISGFIYWKIPVLFNVSSVSFHFFDALLNLRNSAKKKSQRAGMLVGRGSAPRRTACRKRFRTQNQDPADVYCNLALPF